MTFCKAMQSNLKKGRGKHDNLAEQTNLFISSYIPVHMCKEFLKAGKEIKFQVEHSTLFSSKMPN